MACKVKYCCWGGDHLLVHAQAGVVGRAGHVAQLRLQRRRQVVRRLGVQRGVPAAVDKTEICCCAVKPTQ